MAKELVNIAKAVWQVVKFQQLSSHAEEIRNENSSRWRTHRNE